MRLCFVVHRYAPYPGGSEYYVQWMAEECVRRGIEVTVFAGENRLHQGDLNGVRVTANPMVLHEPFHAVIVHGGDVGTQNHVLSHIALIRGPVMYLIIKPSHSQVCLQGLRDARWIGCSTFEDWDHVKQYSMEHKAVAVKHGIHPIKRLGQKGLFRTRHNIAPSKKMFLSCGGYWHNKKMKELAQVFESVATENMLLVTTGYDNRSQLMPSPSQHVLPLLLENEHEVGEAIADADLYIMHSSEEGFGLVLLECLLNKTPWISRHIAAARILQSFGRTYQNDEELQWLLQYYSPSQEMIDRGVEYVHQHHLIQHTVDQILAAIQTGEGSQ